MWLRHARDLALYVRSRRRELKMSQAELAEAAGVSRRWVSDLEGGKPTAEVGLVLQTFDALGLVFDVRPEEAWPRSDDAVDLDQLLDEHRYPVNE